MATLEPEISCDNILDVLKKAGFDKCPEACCASHATYTSPHSTLYIGIGYMNFGDKDIKFGTYGIDATYTGMITPSLGITVDGGYYTHTKKDDPVKDISNLLNITAGLTYYPLVKKQTTLKYPLLSTHALVGLMDWMQKTTVNGGSSTSSSKSSFSFNIGAALDWKLGSSFDLRLPEVDYIPSFFASSTQSNIRISGGLCYKFSRRNK